MTLRSSPLLSTFQSCSQSAAALHRSSFTDTYSHIVVAASCRQSSLAVGLEVGRVYGSVLVVPGHQQWGSLHCGRGHGSGPFDMRVFEGCSVLRRCLQRKGRLLDDEAPPAKRCGARGACGGWLTGERFAIVHERRNVC